MGAAFMRFSLSFAACLLLAASLAKAENEWKLSEIRVRDPFIVAEQSTQTYYLYAQMANRLDNPPERQGVEVYESKDLETWRGPYAVFEVTPDHWARQQVWAPEVHRYAGKYYLFVTFGGAIAEQVQGRPAIRPRGTQILVADTPRGPFRPFANKPHTPEQWMALDGTLWVEDSRPWMIFCHEWVEIEDGTMELVELTADLSDTVGEPTTLFKATDAPWVRSRKDAGGDHHGYVTDGAFLYRTKAGKLLMIWSSFGEQQYAIGLAESSSGKIQGPWRQIPDLLFSSDGGHGMIFRTFDGRLMLVFHQPNRDRKERAQLYELEDTGETLRLKR